ncbi:hypothetical protein [Phenylobacterium sp.]|uniref:hypothetical protein n=1 Tax=Phenylobacterium sp. TaxID=1871053 RepID=UPI002DE83F5D|nr:hypothetical protein [Phenylobacterium sp.]
MSGPYVLATSCATPDREFPSLGALAAALLEQRSDHPLALRRAQLTRCELPGGHVLAVRRLDGSCGGRGMALGYVFLPDYGRDEPALGRLLGCPKAVAV